MITQFWIHIIRNIVTTVADLFSPFYQNLMYEDLIIALQLAPRCQHNLHHLR
jgi:hypothetical protein